MKELSTEKMERDLIEVVAALVGLPPTQIKKNSRLREDLGMDSLQSMELLSRMTEDYGLDVDLDEVMGVATIGEVIVQLCKLYRERNLQ